MERNCCLFFTNLYYSRCVFFSVLEGFMMQDVIFKVAER